MEESFSKNSVLFSIVFIRTRVSKVCLSLLKCFIYWKDTLVELEIVDCYYLLLRYPRIRRLLIQTSALWRELLESLIPWTRRPIEGSIESESEEKDAIKKRFKLNVRLTVFEIFISLFQDANKEQR